MVMKLKVSRKNIYKIIVLLVLFLLITLYTTKTMTWFSALKWHVFNNNPIKYKNIELEIPLRCWAEEVEEMLFIYSIPQKKNNLPFNYMSIQKLYVAKQKLDELNDSIIIETEVKDSAEYVFSREIQFNNVVGYCSYYKDKKVNKNNSINRYYARITIPNKNIYIFVGYILESDINFYENLIKQITFSS